MAGSHTFLIGLLCLLGVFFQNCSPTPSAKLPQQALPAQAMSLAVDTLAMATPPDSLQAAIEAARLGSICTLERLMGIFESEVWQAPSEAQRIQAWNQQSDLVRWMGIMEEEDHGEVEFFWQMLQA
ncbi:MAG: hypothetical protein AAF804_11930, partial [Bacteroidota bacterium]